MQKLQAGFDFIFSSYKRTALLLLVGFLLLLVPIVSSVRDLSNSRESLKSQVLGKTTSSNSLLAQGPIAPAEGDRSSGAAADNSGQPNLYMGQVQLRRNAASAAYPNGNCSNGTLVTEGMTLNSGEIIEVCVTYGNNGTAASGVFKMDNYIHRTTQPAAQQHGWQSYPIGAAPISNGLATQLGSITPSISVCASNCHAGVFIDSDNTVAESNENDNFAQSVTYNVTAQNTPTPIATSCVACAAPPTGCTYVGGSCASCGTLSCPPTAAPTCSPRPGGLDGFINDDGVFGIAGGALPPGGTFCPNVGPSITSTTIAPIPVIANGYPASEYKITMTSTDPQGANTIFRQYASVNQPDTGGAQRRGVVGWSAVGFEKYWGNVIKPGTVALRCVRGGGAVAIYGGAGFGSEYMTVRWCSTNATGNTRTTEMYVSFNPNFTAPASNTLYGFTEDAGGLVDGWKAGQTFSLADPCQYKPQGDANCDRKVNMDDFNLWKNIFLNLDTNGARADFNNDGKFDTDDFNIWRAGNYNSALPH